MLDHRREQVVRVPCRERLAFLGAAGIKDWDSAVDRFRKTVDALELVELAVPVKVPRAVRPAFFYNVVPLLSQPVACFVVTRQLESQCFVLRFVPAADDIDTGPAVANLVQGSQLFRGNDGVVKSCVCRGEYRDVPGPGQQARGPGQGLQHVMLEIGSAAVTNPAGDG